MGNKIKTFIATSLEFICYFLVIAFVEWDFTIEHWHPLSRLAYLLILIYAITRNDDN